MGFYEGIKTTAVKYIKMARFLSLMFLSLFSRLSAVRHSRGFSKQFSPDILELSCKGGSNGNRVLSSGVGVQAKTLGQQVYVDALMTMETPVVACVGSAGSGKTMLACDAFTKLFGAGHYKRLIITRPSVPVEGENLGFLPGGLQDKMDPWTKPIFDILGNYYSAGQLKNMVENRVIEVVPLAFMRGRSFHHSFILADEMQNASPRQFQMLMTRMGLVSKMVITGDLGQSDLGAGNGLADFCCRYKKRTLDGASLCFLSGEDVQRSAFAKKVVAWYDGKNIEDNWNNYDGPSF